MLFLIDTDGVPSVASMVRFENDTAAPAAPSLNDTDPDSPANDNNPEVKGTAEAGSTVRIYSDRRAAPAPSLASGSAAAFTGAGISAAVSAPIRPPACARPRADAASIASGCSPALAYTEDSTAPQTQVDSGPPGPDQ